MPLFEVRQKLILLGEMLTFYVTVWSVLTAKLQLRKTCHLLWKCITDWSILALHER